MILFLANGRHDDEATLTTYSESLRACARTIAPTGGSIITARDFHTARFQAAGGWPGYIAEVVSGRDFNTQQPHCDAIVLPVRDIGKGNRDIVAGCLAVSKPVYLLEDGKLARVARITCVDGRNFQSGWRVTTIDDVNTYAAGGGPGR